MLQLLLDFFGGKAKTRIFTSFLGWLLIFHIDILFLSFLVDQSLIFEKTQQLKGEYLISYITSFGNWSIIVEISRVLVAMLATYLMIWVIPKLISEKSYKAELDIEYILRKMKIDKEEELNIREKDAADQQIEIAEREKQALIEQINNIEREKEVAVERAKLDIPPKETRWDIEFQAFMKNSKSKTALQEIKHTVYAEGGNLYQYLDANGYSTSPNGVTADHLALADTNGLVEFSDKGRILSLTEKGKYFIKKMDSFGRQKPTQE